MLQRGRGAGYLAALKQPEDAAPLVVGCIHEDPRWDHQVEDRAWYYAALVVELEIDVTKVLPSFDSPVDPTGDDGFWLATGALAHCAQRGIPGAVAELRRYLRSGRDVQLAMDALVPFAGHEESEDLVDDLLGPWPAEVIEDALIWAPEVSFDRPPWPGWRRDRPVLDAVVARVLEREPTRRMPPSRRTSTASSTCGTRSASLAPSQGSVSEVRPPRNFWPKQLPAPNTRRASPRRCGTGGHGATDRFSSRLRPAGGRVLVPLLSKLWANRVMTC